MHRTFCYALLPVLIGVAACHNPFGGGYSCPAYIKPAIVVTIRDASTGAPLATAARGAVHDVGYIDSLTPHAGIGPDLKILVSRRAADERPGTYFVEVKHPGYRPWTLSGVRAVAGVCGVETRRLSAALEPAL